MPKAPENHSHVAITARSEAHCPRDQAVTSPNAVPGLEPQPEYPACS